MSETPTKLEVHQLEVQFVGECWTLNPDEILTFGRDVNCDITIGATDRGISRLAGTFSEDGSSWWITNKSSSRILQVIDDTGLQTPIPPGRKRAVDRVHLSLVLTGEMYTHVLKLRTAEMSLAADSFEVLDVEETRSQGYCTINERIALVAIAEGYLLDPPRYNPDPRTYQEAAERVGLPRTTVVKRIENLRKRLIRAGVTGLEVEDARRALTEHALTSGMISRADLPFLDLERESPT